MFLHFIFTFLICFCLRLAYNLIWIPRGYLTKFDPLLGPAVPMEIESRQELIFKQILPRAYVVLSQNWCNI